MSKIHNGIFSCKIALAVLLFHDVRYGIISERIRRMKLIFGTVPTYSKIFSYTSQSKGVCKLYIFPSQK